MKMTTESKAAGLNSTANRQSSFLRRASVPLIAVALTLASCDNDRPQNSHGPIVLGDSSTIVTETNPELLADRVVDLNPVITEVADTVATTPAAPPKDTVVTAAPDPKPVAAPAAAPLGKGLNAAFSEVSIFIPNIETKTYGKQDLSKARGATYELTGGTLAGNQIRNSGGTVTKITQRYQTVLAIPNGRNQINLETLGNYTSGWETLKGSNGAYTISGLDPNKLEYKNVSANAIRNAVEKTARQQRMSRRDTQQLLNDTKNIRSASQGKVKLRSVSWRIEGKDARGKSFSKEIRMDVPLS